MGIVMAATIERKKLERSKLQQERDEFLLCFCWCRFRLTTKVKGSLVQATVPVNEQLPSLLSNRANACLRICGTNQHGGESEWKGLRSTFWGTVKPSFGEVLTQQPVVLPVHEKDFTS